MIYNLYDSLKYTPDTNGCWYIKSAVDYDGTIKISADNVTYYEESLAVLAKLEKDPEVTGYNIWIDLTDEDLSTIVFVYITGCAAPDVYSDALCEGCLDCATVTFTKNDGIYLDVTAELLNENTHEVANFEFTVQSYIEPNVELSNGDKIHFEISELGVDVYWIIGQKPTGTGFSSDTNGKWAEIKQYFTMGFLTSSELLAGTMQFTFNKKAWADATGNYNMYSNVGVQTKNDALELSFLFTTVVGVNASDQVDVTINKIKVNAFEDTSDSDLYTIKPKGVGTWSNLDGAQITENCSAECLPVSNLWSWYSNILPNPCKYKITGPPSTIIECQQEADLPLTVDLAFTTEANFLTQLNTLFSAMYYFSYVKCNLIYFSNYNVKGYNTTFICSRYMLETEDDFTYFQIRYDNGTANDGKRVQMDLDNVTLF